MEELTFDQRVAASVARGRYIQSQCDKIFEETEKVSKKIRRRNRIEQVCIALGCDITTVSVGEFAQLLNSKKREMGL